MGQLFGSVTTSSEMATRPRFAVLGLGKKSVPRLDGGWPSTWPAATQDVRVLRSPLGRCISQRSCARLRVSTGPSSQHLLLISVFITARGGFVILNPSFFQTRPLNRPPQSTHRRFSVARTPSSLIPGASRGATRPLKTFVGRLARNGRVLPELQHPEWCKNAYPAYYSGAHFFTATSNMPRSSIWQEPLVPSSGVTYARHPARWFPFER